MSGLLSAGGRQRVMLLMHPGRIDLVFGGDFDLLGSVAERDEVSAE